MKCPAEIQVANPTSRMKGDQDIHIGLPEARKYPSKLGEGSKMSLETLFYMCLFTELDDC